jgi:hypothetical protein
MISTDAKILYSVLSDTKQHGTLSLTIKETCTCPAGSKGGNI